MKKVLSLIYVFLFLIIISCKAGIIQDNNFIESIVPYANKTELNELSEKGYVDYRISRTLAMLELQNFNELNSEAFNTVLSETPVIIWKNDDIPLYYEFHILDNGTDKGFVTCNVDKEKGDPVAFVSFNPQTYQVSDARAVLNYSKKIISNNYPNIFFETKENLRSIENCSCEKSEEALYMEWINSISEEELLDAEVTRDELLEEYYSTKEDESNRLEILWTLIEEEADNLINITDEEILAAFSENSRNVNIENSSDFKKINAIFVEPYASFIGKRSFSNCVPSVIEFIAQAYNSNITNSLTNKSIYSIIFSEMGDRVVDRNDKSWSVIEKVTNNSLTLKNYLTHNFSTISKNLENNGLPVISNRTGGTNIFNWSGKIGHCRCVIGTATIKNGTPKKFLWIKWTDWSKNNYYYMYDNGYDSASTANITEFNSYKPSKNTFWEKDNSWFYYGTKALVSK